jgi:hypothetical protein
MHQLYQRPGCVQNLDGGAVSEIKSEPFAKTCISPILFLAPAIILLSNFPYKVLHKLAFDYFHPLDGIFGLHILGSEQGSLDSAVGCVKLISIYVTVEPNTLAH